MPRYTGYDDKINYDYDLEAAAEYLDELLGREATDEEIQEFLEWQESRALDFLEYQEEDN